MFSDNKQDLKMPPKVYNSNTCNQSESHYSFAKWEENVNVIIGDLFSAMQDILAGTCDVFMYKLSDKYMEFQIQSCSSSPVIMVQYEVVSKKCLRYDRKSPPHYLRFCEIFEHDHNYCKDPRNDVTDTMKENILPMPSVKPELQDSSHHSDNEAAITVKKKIPTNSYSKTTYSDVTLEATESNSNNIRNRLRRNKKRIQPQINDMSCVITRNYRKSSRLWAKKKLDETKENPFVCKECDKSFSCETYLIRHQRIHSIKSHVTTKRKPSVCDRDELSSSEENKPCTSAKMNFSTLEEDRSVSENSATSPDKMSRDGRSFSCEECNRSFSLMRNLIRHQSMHTDAEHLSQERPRNSITSSRRKTVCGKKRQN